MSEPVSVPTQVYLDRKRAAALIGHAPRFHWPDEPPSVEFGLGYGEWIRLLRRHGREVTDVVGLRPDEDATTSYDFVTRSGPVGGRPRRCGRRAGPESREGGL